MKIVMLRKEPPRTIIACALSLMLASVTCLAQSLREYADKRGILIGAAVNPARFSEPEYAATLAREFNMIEPENVVKWGTVRPDRATFNFGPGDQVVAFARAHGMKVRGHCLVWSEYNPKWLAKGRFTPAQMSALLREHITRVMKHYAGQVFAWDVVNEAFLADGRVETSIWYDQPGIGFNGQGTAYVEQAFRWAHEADPKALLFYNDYDAEGLNAKSDAVYRMVKDFKRRGVPLDGVGLQMHIFNLSTKEIADLEANIARLTALGLQVHITEMDVGVPLTKAGQIMTQADLQRQADVYRFVASACLKQPGCAAIQTWGFTDKYTWVPGYTKGAKGAPLPFDQAYHMKPAYKALLDALRPPPVAAPAADPPVPRTDQNSMLAHAQLLEKRKKGRIDVYFEGDSITRRWGTSDEQYKAFLANWRQNFFGWNAADFGWGGDTTQNILWRLHNGELDGVNPKVIVLLAGTNNVGNKSPQGPDDPRVADVTRGIKAILDVCRLKAPKAKIVLMGITPRNDNMAVLPIINKINEHIAKFADGKSIRYVNINDRLADKDGRLLAGMASGDGLHLEVKGYQVWADVLKSIFTELLGPPAKEDHAPPPTGDPSAGKRLGLSKRAGWRCTDRSATTAGAVKKVELST